MEEIDLKELIEIFLEKKITIILLTAIFMVLGYIYTAFIVVPEYSSSTTLILAQSASENKDGAGITTSDITLNSKLISTYRELVRSKTVIRQVISNLGINENEEGRIRKNVSVTAEEGTEILKITVTNQDAQKASDIANEMALVFIAKVKDVYKIDNVQTVDPAEVEDTPSNINLTKNIVIFGAIGFIIAAGYIFIIFMLDNSIKSQDDIEKNMDIPVLANIPVYENETIRNRVQAKKKTRGGKRK